MAGASGSGKSKKKKKLEVDMESFAEVGDKIAPFVGYFPSGFDPIKAGSAGDGKQGGSGGAVAGDLDIKVFRHQTFGNRMQLVVSPGESNVDFVGSSHAGESESHQGCCTYALGVLDKETQTLKIVPIASNKILRLEPRLRDFTKNVDEKEVKAEKKELQMKDLTNLYGTKKERRRVGNFEASRFEGNDVAQKMVGEELKKVMLNKEAAEHVNVNRNLPPYDVEATTPEKAYLLDKIIKKEEWNCLTDIMDLLQTNPDSILSTEFWQNCGYPIFVCHRIRKLGEVNDVHEKKKLAGVFSYISHLVKFQNLARQYKKLRQISNPDVFAKYHEIPIIFYQKFFKMFVDTERVKLSPEKNDLLISYVLVLTLFADGFETEITDIAKDLQVSSTSLRPYYVELGCKIRKSLSMKLAVPLQLPERRVRKRLRR